MIELFEALTPLEQIYWVTALLGSVIFVIILLLTFIGGDMDSDMDADGTDFDADDGGVGFQFFTIKNLVAFFTIFGWAGITCIDHGYSTTITLIVSIVAGLLMMVVTSLLFYWMMKMTASGTLKIKNAIGAVGEVYLPIGKERSSMGKVQIKVQGSLRELEAITDSTEDLGTSTMVKVLEVVSAELLLVERLTK